MSKSSKVQHADTFKILQSDKSKIIESDINYYQSRGWKLFTFETHLVKPIVDPIIPNDSMVYTATLTKPNNDE